MSNPKQIIYFPGLNGLRAIAAIAVVICHITINLKDFNLDPHIFGVLQNGKPKGLDLAGYGVSIFFVLSGFLITYLLQAEKEVQEIDVKKFYLRRIYRIWPLYYLYFAVVIIILLLIGEYVISIKSLLLYIFYAANVPFIFGVGIPYIGHYWSLGVEEQFYLFWPWVNKKIGTYLIPFTLFLIVALLGTKVLLHFIYPDSLLELVIHVTRFHCMLIGGLGAILFKQNNKLFLAIADNKVSQGICWLIIFMVMLNKFHFASVIDNEIICVVALIIIIGQINIKNRIVNLETRIFDYLGKISYGIYVIHPLLILLFSKILFQLNIESTFKYAIVYLAVLAATILFSHLSYIYFERYFLNKKKKFMVVKSSATRNF